MKRLFYVFLIAFGLTSLLYSCKPTHPTPPGPPAGAMILWPNVHIIDSTKWILYTQNGYPQNGLYSYSFVNSTPYIGVNIGDIIVGASNGGYIRKVTGVSIENDRYLLTTQQGYMSDVFKSGTFTFQLPINQSGGTNQNILSSFTNTNIYTTPGFNVNMLYGQFNIQPSFSVSFTFDSSLLMTYFQMTTNNTPLNDTFAINGVGTEPRGIVGYTTLSTISASSIQWIPSWLINYGNISVPVVTQLSLTLNAVTGGNLTYNGQSTSPGVNVKGYWSSSQVFSGGMKFTTGQWQPVFNYSNLVNKLNFDNTSNLAESDVVVSSTAQFNSAFYSIPGPQVTVGFTANLNQIMNQNSTTYFNQGIISYNFLSDSQEVAPIFEPNMTIPFGHLWNYDTSFYQSPYTLTLISGSGDTVNILHTVPNPLVVKVTDSRGNAVKNVTVTFTVLGTGGDGTINGGATTVNLLTDQNGLAQVTWKLGQQFYTQSGPQLVQATALNGDQQPLNGSPVIFKAYGD